MTPQDVNFLLGQITAQLDGQGVAIEEIRILLRERQHQSEERYDEIIQRLTRVEKNGVGNNNHERSLTLVEKGKWSGLSMAVSAGIVAFLKAMGLI